MACAVEDRPVTRCRLWRGPNIRGYGRRYDPRRKRTVLGAEFGLSQANISAVILGKTYAVKRAVNAAGGES